MHGPAEPLGGTGLVFGRFLPFHRGHELVVDFARASVEKLVVLVLVDHGDPVDGRVRVRWIAEQYPDVRVDHVRAADLEPATLARAAAPYGRADYLFASDLAYEEVAAAMGATFVAVDPGHAAVPVASADLRANVMEHFRALARTARPWCVRRVAVVGPPASGKTALCAWLGERFGCAVVPAWASGRPFTAAELQLAARSQIAVEDALARQLPDGNPGLLVCDTELATLALRAERAFGPPPDWIRTEARRRAYDLHLMCPGDAPDDALRERFPRAIVLDGAHPERCAAAADAIVSLFAPRSLLSARGAAMK